MVKKLSSGLVGNTGLATMAEGHALGDAVGVGGTHDGNLAEGAAALGRLGLSQVANARVTTQDLAGGRDLEPLGRGLLRFDTFWATHIKILIQLQKSMNYTWRVSTWQARFFNFLLVAGLQAAEVVVGWDGSLGSGHFWADNLGVITDYQQVAHVPPHPCPD